MLIDNTVFFMAKVDIDVEISSEGIVGGIEICDPAEERSRILGERMQPQIVVQLEQRLVGGQMRILSLHNTHVGKCKT